MNPIVEAMANAICEADREDTIRWLRQRHMKMHLLGLN
jgi:hypothetical protein